MRAVQNIPIYDAFADSFKLDILIEDYLEECSLNNEYSRNLRISNDSVVKPVKEMPTVNLYAILVMPHKIRLDLSVMLTASILFHIPLALLRDAMVILLSKHMSGTDISNLCEVPLFVRTGLVSMIRRISRRELEECKINVNLL
eukprot:gene41861-51883_t